jgi:hypothetical protein
LRKKILPTHEVGSGNIFANLGLPNPEEHQLKAALIVQLHRLLKARKLTQTAAAKPVLPAKTGSSCGQQKRKSGFWRPPQPMSGWT